MYCATFSIVAHDPDSQSWGVAVASKFLAVGAYVPYARARAGAIATQARVNLTYGADGLAQLGRGLDAQDVMRRLIERDSGRAERQAGIVDARGAAATYTGEHCMPWAGGVAGDGFAIQGNILAGPQVVDAMAAAYVAASGELAPRMLAALAAGDAAGGDRRGKQSAALLVVKPQAGYGGLTDRFMDLRVDDHAQPIGELGRLLALHGLYFGSTPADEKLPLDSGITRPLQRIMRRLGYYHGDETGNFDDTTRDALRAFSGTENLEERVDLVHGTIDLPAWEHIRRNFSA